MTQGQGRGKDVGGGRRNLPRKTMESGVPLTRVL
jgi:hypothetical protein